MNIQEISKNLIINQCSDVEKFRAYQESNESWEIRKKFLKDHWNDFPVGELVKLSKIFTDDELSNNKDPSEAKKRIAEIYSVHDDINPKKRYIEAKVRQNNGSVESPIAVRKDIFLCNIVNDKNGNKTVEYPLSSASDQIFKNQCGRIVNVMNRKLSTKARKRCRKLIAANIPPDEAHDLCLLPIEQMLKLRPGLRTILQEDSPEPPNNPETKPVVCYVNNIIPMNGEQIKLVRRTLLESVKNAPRGLGPRFTEFMEKPGQSIMITCANIPSSIWLINEIGKIKPWENAQLLVTPAIVLKSTAVRVYIPSSEAESVEDVLRLLKAQNDSLITEFWRVLHCKHYDNGFALTCALDETSLKAIRSMKCRAHLGFKTVTFEILPGSRLDI